MGIDWGAGAENARERGGEGGTERERERRGGWELRQESRDREESWR